MKNENRQVSSMPKAILAWPFQETRISVQDSDSCRSRYNLQVWRDTVAALSSSVTYGLWQLSRTLKFISLRNPVPPNPNIQQQALSWREVPSASPKASFLRGTHHPLLCHGPENHTHNKVNNSFQSFEGPLLILQSVLPPPYSET